jgi:hypothetical protein
MQICFKLATDVYIYGLNIFPAEQCSFFARE